MSRVSSKFSMAGLTLSGHASNREPSSFCRTKPRHVMHQSTHSGIVALSRGMLTSSAVPRQCKIESISPMVGFGYHKTGSRKRGVLFGCCRPQSEQDMSQHRRKVQARKVHLSQPGCAQRTYRRSSDGFTQGERALYLVARCTTHAAEIDDQPFRQICPCAHDGIWPTVVARVEDGQFGAGFFEAALPCQQGSPFGSQASVLQRIAGLRDAGVECAEKARRHADQSAPALGAWPVRRSRAPR